MEKSKTLRFMIDFLSIRHRNKDFDQLDFFEQLFDWHLVQYF